MFTLPNGDPVCVGCAHKFFAQYNKNLPMGHDPDDIEFLNCIQCGEPMQSDVECARRGLLAVRAVLSLYERLMEDGKAPCRLVGGLCAGLMGEVIACAFHDTNIQYAAPTLELPEFPAALRDMGMRHKDVVALYEQAGAILKYPVYMVNSPVARDGRGWYFDSSLNGEWHGPFATKEEAEENRNNYHEWVDTF